MIDVLLALSLLFQDQEHERLTACQVVLFGESEVGKALLVKGLGRFNPNTGKFYLLARGCAAAWGDEGFKAISVVFAPDGSALFGRVEEASRARRQGLFQVVFRGSVRCGLGVQADGIHPIWREAYDCQMKVSKVVSFYHLP